MLKSGKLDRSNMEDIIALTPLQEGLLFHYIQNPHSELYFEQLSLRLKGRLDDDIFVQSWNHLIEANEVLRSVIRWEKLEKPLQIIVKQILPPIYRQDLSHLAQEETEGGLLFIKEEDRKRAIDITLEPYRITLCKISDTEYEMIFSSHHILLDGWSYGVLFKEFIEIYSSIADHQPVILPEKTKFKQFVNWIQNRDKTSHHLYWKEYLEGFHTKTQLPVRHGIQDNAGFSSIRTDLSIELATTLHEFVKQHKISLASLFYTAWALTLHGYNGSSDIVFGSTVSGRTPEIKGIEHIAGLFINTLPLRVQVEPHESISHLLSHVHQSCIEREKFSSTPILDIKEASGYSQPGELFDSLVIVENYPLDHQLKHGRYALQLTEYAMFEVTHYPLTLLISAFGEISFEFKYNKQIFEAHAVNELCERFKHVLGELISKPEGTVQEIEWLTETEKTQILSMFNDTDQAVLNDKLIHELFEEQAEQTPDSIALTYQNVQLTYRELNEQANRLANYLNRSYEPQPNDRIGILMDRSEKMMVGLLAVLKTGASYVPLDPAYPQDRIQYVIEDSGMKLLITESKHAGKANGIVEHVVPMDFNWRDIVSSSPENLVSQQSAETLAYVIYTSGSTGKPKGVMVTHRNVHNFFLSMDQRVGGTSDDCLLAVTTISFDISVLELLWTLTRGISVVLGNDLEQGLGNYDDYLSLRKAATIDFSLFFFSSYDHDGERQKYGLLMDSVKYADRNGYQAVWTPERHFHEFGGLFPNPSVLSSALSMVTENIGIRSGSVVAPLHHPIRLAEEWAVVDQLSNGRTGVSFAAGWHADDFILAPEAYQARSAKMLEQIDLFKRLWRGEAVEFNNGTGQPVSVKTYPRPVQQNIPIWITTGGNKETFVQAGKLGANVLTHLLGQDLEALEQNIDLYRRSLAEHGHSPDTCKVTLMLHTYISDDLEAVREKVKGPFCNYLRSSVDLIRNLARSLQMEDAALSDEVMEQLLEVAFDKYWQAAALLGTPESCERMVRKLIAIGVDEIACLVDFGIDYDSVMEGLDQLTTLKQKFTHQETSLKPVNKPITMFQCTPSRMKMLLNDAHSSRFIKSLKTVLVGGEAFDEQLAMDLRRHTDARMINMYGPTETTIWSSTYEIGEDGFVCIGKPILNTKFLILDHYHRLVPVGVKGEIWIGGDGVSQGYINRTELTEERFISSPFHPGERLYKTGDVGRWLPDGRLECLGRIDQQVKIRGYRIELGEIESNLLLHPAIREAAVIVWEDQHEQSLLCAYYVSDEPVAFDELTAYLSLSLPDYMIPSSYVQLEAMPLTPNGKIDRKELPEPAAIIDDGLDYVAPANEIERKLVSIWEEILSVQNIGTRHHFFKIGGHSLRATLLMSRINKEWDVEIPLSVIFKRPTIAELAIAITMAGNSFFVPIPNVEWRMYYPVSSEQKRMYVLNQLSESNKSYNETVFMQMDGELQVDKVQHCIRLLTLRHEVLRTSFHLVEGELVQTVQEEVDSSMEILPTQEDSIEAVLEKFIRPFDLEQAPLFRFGLFSLNPRKHIFAFDIHHIISDGISMDIFLREFTQLYQDQDQCLPETRIQYKDYAVWQQGFQSSPRFLKQKKFWSEQLTGELPLLNLPLDYARPSVRTYAGDRVTVSIDPKLLDDLKLFSYRSETTMFMILLSAYSVLLSKYTGQTDIIVGTPVAGRQHADTHQVMGLFLNTLAIRCFPEPDQTAIQYLHSIKDTSLKAFENQSYPFEEVVSSLDLRQDLSRNPLVETMFVLQNASNSQISFGDASLRPYPLHNKLTKFDLTLNVAEAGDGLSCRFDFCTSLFEKETIERLSEHFINILNFIVSHPQSSLSSIELPDEAEKAQLLERFNDTEASYPSDRTIHSLFEEQVRKTPDHVAVVHEEERLTYAELNARANRLAHVLRKQGVGPDEIVGLILERSVDMIVGIMGILKAGGAYLPIDPDYPADRIRFMLENSGTKWLVIDPAISEQPVFGGTLIRLDEAELAGRDRSNSELPGSNPELAGRDSLNPDWVNGPSDLAYVIYTSGTTGTPKGTLIEHRNVVRLLVNDRQPFAFGEEDVWTLFHSYCFDFSVWEMYGALLNGGRLIVVPKETVRDPAAFAKLLVDTGTTVLNQTPAAFYALAEREAENGKELALRYVIFGGEALKPVMLKDFHERYPETKLVNMYGITETTVHVTYKEITADEIERNASSIGKPIPTLTAYILDSQRRLVPIGVTGELYVGGEGVCRGYLNRPELTAERFVENPYVPGERLYKTGDWARWLPNGEMEYYGRIDEQVKIRGYRIELGEIEAAILQEPTVREAVVMAKEDRDGSLYLCAYISVAADKEGEAEPAGKEGEVAAGGKEGKATAEVKASLQRKLPAYMVPSAFVALEKLPLTANGKIDRKALPEPEQGSAGMPYEAPVTAMEAGLARLWEDILGVERIGAADNFFERGGHSLRAMTLLSRMHKEWNVQMPLKTIFESPTLRGLAQAIQAIEGLAVNPYAAIEPVEGRTYYPVSPAQRRMLILQQLEGAEVSYNMPAVLMMEGPLDRSRLETAFAHLVARHESLRTSFEWVDGEPVQRVHGEVPFTISWESCSEGEVASRVEAFIRPFDLESAPLLRVGLLHLSEERHVLLYDMHHIISDGVSMGVLEQEFAVLYRGDELIPLRIQYKDYTVWQNERLGDKRLGAEELAKQEDYWKDVFSGDIPVLSMPTDHARPVVRSFEGDHIGFTVEAELAERLRQMGADQGATLYMVLLAAYTALLSHYTGQEDIVVGTPVAGRPHADLEQMIGMFVGTLALRNYPSGEKRFAEFVEEVKQRVLQAFEHQDYPFEELVEKLDVARDMSRNPLFDTMFVLQNLERRETELEGLRLSPYAAGNGAAKFDLALTAAEGADDGAAGLYFTLDYSTALYERQTMERLADHFSRLLEQLAANPDMKLADIEMVSVDEKNQLLHVFNDTQASYPSDRTIHSLFEEQVRKTPDHVAVVHEEERLTYAELNARANRLAHALREQGVGPDEIVGLMMERSVDMAVGMLGILKAGGSFMAIDPGYPAVRIQQMLADSQTSLLVAQEGTADLASAFDGRVLLLNEANLSEYKDTNPTWIGDARQLAYVIFTSGSTGRPKGVEVEHRSLVNLCFWHVRQFEISETDRSTQYASCGFDASIWEWFPYLITGASVHIVPERLRLDMEGLSGYYRENGITMSWLPPQIYEQMLEQENVTLRHLLTGGDKVKAHQEKSYKVWNTYGPTEGTVICTSHRIEGQQMNIPIGKPLSNTRIYIVDRAGKPQPIGVPGELLVGGDGVARGYVNRPELTAERFGIDPFVEGGRLYRTGDLARWLADGTIEYLGRIDEQVKIRGYRIEPGEIEYVLLGHASVREAIVIVREGEHGEKSLCAYYTTNETIAASAIREYVSEKVPAYMVPSAFVALEKLPLTVNGKLDRKALPEPELSNMANTDYMASENPIQEMLLDVWSEVLKVSNIGIQHRFFDLGGDSIKAIQIASRIHQKGYKIDIKDLFQKPTVKELSTAVAKAEQLICQDEVAGYSQLTPIQLRFLQQNEEHANHFNQSIFLYGKHGFKEDLLVQVFHELVKHHDNLRSVFIKEEASDYRQFYRSSNESDLFDFEVIDLTAHDDEVGDYIHLKSTEIQKGMDIVKGPLVQFGLFKTKQGDHLLICIHHFVVDGVSWRIFLEDFKMAYEQAVNGQPIQLPFKTHSFAEWSNQLYEYSSSDALSSELQYWERVVSAYSSKLPRDRGKQQSVLADNTDVRIELTEEQTSLLLTGVNRIYNTQMNDILLTALGLALVEWKGITNIFVEMEGHGRSEAIVNTDVNRTIGWFTSIYPYLLVMPNDKDLSYQIKSVKESLRAVPNLGIGYGMLKEIGHRGNKLNVDVSPEISFNYLGQFDSDTETDLFAISPYSTGESMSSSLKSTYALEINGIVTNSKLVFSFGFSRKEFEAATINSLADSFRTQLISVIQHCMNREFTEITPSDLLYNELTLDQLDEIASEIATAMDDIDFDIES
ncbi:D-alanine--D-alanyl carrier protein ligase [Paenibacillus plantiphilus]|uniref:D-alanine--D-alanyl carrier protein ligase n=1 Tax=Paenibacillus plantiphilus TaxID=2905650 RepID=A0ABM9C9Z0_9BACL|nr:non-ribosomal peptide synthetase [Paenibacillus plantiphilus]CAH1206498.1 D-alanine--D-alanyl carrier protein ligase [Paenibacillus plantiphilus]